MHVCVGTYKGFEVNDLDPIAPPDPHCCSDPTVLCAQCAIKALAVAGYTANELMIRSKAVVVNDNDDEDILTIPASSDLLAVPVENVSCPDCVNCGEDNQDLLPLPTMNDVIDCPEDQKSDDCGDVLIPPTI